MSKEDRFSYQITYRINIVPGKKYNCWWCKLECNDKSIVHCPFDMKTVDKKHIFSVDGIFCSYNCVQAYINTSIHLVEFKDCTRLLQIMVAELTGTQPVPITPANPWQFLSIFGGQMSVEQFREQNKTTKCLEKNVVQTFPQTTVFQITKL